MIKIDFDINRCDEFTNSLEKVNTISYYDGELTTLFEDKVKKQMFVLNWIDCDEDNNYYLAFNTTLQNLAQFRKIGEDRISLLDLIKLGTVFFIVRVNSNSDFNGAISIDLVDIPEDYLPTDDSKYLKELDPCLEETVLELMIQEEEGKICKCSCHQKGVIMRHMMPCCQYTYIQYINSDGSIDFEKLALLKILNTQSINAN